MDPSCFLSGSKNRFICQLRKLFLGCCCRLLRALGRLHSRPARWGDHRLPPPARQAGRRLLGHGRWGSKFSSFPPALLGLCPSRLRGSRGAGRPVKGVLAGRPPDGELFPARPPPRERLGCGTAREPHV
ncbi:hypothetical protein VULLAG_LOCUS20124 [Vulpes lagopus]